MKNKICKMIFLLLPFINIFATSNQEVYREILDNSIRLPDDSLDMKIFEEQTHLLDSLTVKELLMLWRIDSTTCQKKRSAMMAYTILDSIPIKDKSLNYVTSILGTPFSVTKVEYFDSQLEKDTTKIRASYFVDVFCKDGKPIYNGKLNNCMLYIELSPDSLRVISYGVRCN